MRLGLLRRHVFAVCLLCALSDALLIVLGIAGVGSLVQGSRLLLTALSYGGAVFLFIYGLLAFKWVFSPDVLNLGSNGLPPCARPWQRHWHSRFSTRKSIWIRCSCLAGTRQIRNARPRRLRSGGGDGVFHLVFRAGLRGASACAFVCTASCMAGPGPVDWRRHVDAGSGFVVRLDGFGRL